MTRQNQTLPKVNPVPAEPIPDSVVWTLNNAAHQRDVAAGIQRQLDALDGQFKDVQDQLDRFKREAGAQIAQFEATLRNLSGAMRDKGMEHTRASDNMAAAITMATMWCTEHGYPVPDLPAEAPLENTTALPIVGDDTRPDEPPTTVMPKVQES